MWFKLESSETPRLKDPVLLVATSTSVQQYRALYSQARELAKYMLEKMKFDRIATLYSSSLGPEVLVRDDGTCALPACHLYLHRGTRDILLFAGDASPMDDQYEFSTVLLDYAKKAGVKEVYSIGARWAENLVSAFQEPEINGFASSSEAASRLEKHNVKLIKGEAAPYFASIVVAMAGSYDMEGYKLSVDHGEPAPHARSVVRMLEVLTDMIGFQIDYEELKSRITAPPAMRSPDESSIYH